MEANVALKQMPGAYEDLSDNATAEHGSEPVEKGEMRASEEEAGESVPAERQGTPTASVGGASTSEGHADQEGIAERKLLRELLTQSNEVQAEMLALLRDMRRARSPVYSSVHQQLRTGGDTLQESRQFLAGALVSTEKGLLPNPPAGKHEATIDIQKEGDAVTAAAGGKSGAGVSSHCCDRDVTGLENSTGNNLEAVEQVICEKSEAEATVTRNFNDGKRDAEVEGSRDDAMSEQQSGDIVVAERNTGEHVTVVTTTKKPSSMCCSCIKYWIVYIYVYMKSSLVPLMHACREQHGRIVQYEM